MLSIAAMLFIALLAVGVSIPANAFTGSGAASSALAPRNPGHVQKLNVSGSVADGQTSRDEYKTTTLQQVLQAQYAAAKEKSEVESSAGEPTTTGVLFIGASGPLLWPTDVSPEIGHGVTSGHHGQDLLMAGGTPVHAIASGTVIESTTQGSYGQYVVLQSDVGGHVVTSLYAHMQYGSSPVSAGQTVNAGDTIGLVGSTGAATANLLYLRILQDGALVDTVTYIKAAAAGGAAPH